MDEFSWFVGLYEGEGCFCRDKKRNYVCIRISMTDEDTIKRAADFAEVHYFKIHPPSWQKKGWKPQWKMEVSCAKGIELAERMFPYLSERRQGQITEKIEDYYKNRKRVGRPKKT